MPADPVTDVPDVTVVIPTRNRRHLLPNAVASVRRQIEVAWQLVVVDNASSDDTAAYLSELDGDPRVTVVRHPEDRERSASRNSGLAAARGPYVLFLDDDDRLRPGALQTLRRAAARHPGAVATVGAMVRVDGDGGPYRRRVRHPRFPVTRPVWREVLAGWVAYPSQTLYQVAALREVGGWSEEHVGLEDQELLLRLTGRGPVHFIPQSVVEYRRHPDAVAGADHVDRERAIRDARLHTLAPPARRRAERLLVAREQLQAASRAFEADRPRAAAGALARTAWTAPQLLASPVIGPVIVVNLVKALGAAVLPSSLASRARRGVHRWRGDRSP